MYNLIVFLKGSPIQYATKFKEQGTAISARQNILDRRKDFSEGKDSHVQIKGDDGGLIDFWASDYLSSILMFKPEGFDLVGGNA